MPLPYLHIPIPNTPCYILDSKGYGLVNSLARYPQEALPITNYFAASELAPAVARAFNKLKTLRQDARSWLLKYPEHAITGLLPAALGKAGEAGDNARAALRMLTENGHQPLLQEIARRYNQPEVTDAVNALLALDPLDNHPTKSPLFRPFISHRSGRARY